MTSFPHLSTDQVAAFVELARHGQIRGAANSLAITEQGLRNRLLALETQLRVRLYRKERGPRRSTLLTPEGQRFLPHALAFLDRAHALYHACGLDTGRLEVRVVASQYLTRYFLIDALRRFRQTAPDVHVRVSTMNEADLAAALLNDPEVALGLAAPYESSPRLDYTDLLAMGWSLITPPGHPLTAEPAVSLIDVGARPLILYERGSTGRQHVLDAFNSAGVAPTVMLETTSTETVVSMVEAGLGIAVVPLMTNGEVTRGRAVEIRPIVEQIRPIHSGVLTRRGETPSAPAARLLTFILGQGDTQ